MERSIRRSCSFGESPEVDAFLADIEAVCRKHGMCLGHEDYQGNFEVHDLDEYILTWMKGAADDRKAK